MPAESFSINSLPADANYDAPDGSEIRLLPTVNGGGLSHCTLLGGATSSPVSHKTVEEIWYALSGEGDIWRKLGEQEQVAALCEGVAVTIPRGTHFQFRATGPEPLRILIVTMPPWPGPDEAVAVDGPWAPSGAPTRPNLLTRP
jgi:mannose-6-phosphate isomerase-like protein (cupin superfamily)